ncbi:unnamed protein product, partial [Amoebophrya sp. A120]|eukprot:GSA120T00020130001.1
MPEAAESQIKFLIPSSVTVFDAGNHEICVVPAPTDGKPLLVGDIRRTVAAKKGIPAQYVSLLDGETQAQYTDDKEEYFLVDESTKEEGGGDHDQAKRRRISESRKRERSAQQLQGQEHHDDGELSAPVGRREDGDLVPSRGPAGSAGTNAAAARRLSN